MKKELLNEQAYKEVTENTKCVIQFTADWCGPCKSLKPILETTSSQFGVEYRIVNIDNNRNLAMSKGIRSIPFVEIHSGGELKDSFVGSKNKKQLDEIFSAYFGGRAYNE